jgi:hypothetical protein
MPGRCAPSSRWRCACWCCGGASLTATAAVPDAARLGRRAGAILGCLYLFTSLQLVTQISFLVWNGIGLLVYFLYARARAVEGRTQV